MSPKNTALRIRNLACGACSSSRFKNCLLEQLPKLRRKSFVLQPLMEPVRGFMLKYPQLFCQFVLDLNF
ncbi:hypothetical protein CBW56_10500 [Denitratisoma oestradiolicum]|nr:hypothetical protein CBW56_10500 [Denitratisoma oestradiolicum]